MDVARLAFPMLGFCVAPALHAQTLWYVDLAGSAPGIGTEQDPYTSIQHAIDQPGTLSGDRILISPGVYHERIDLRGKELVLRKFHDGLPDLVVLDGDGAGCVVSAVSGEPAGTQLKGFRIINGGADALFPGDALGVTVRGSNLRLVECEVEGHMDASGLASVGGILVDQGSLRLIDCEVVSCSSLEAGGIRALDSTVILEGSRVAACGSPVLENQEGGGLQAYDSVVDLYDTDFFDNHTDRGGGGLNLRDCQVTIQYCMSEDNTAESGAGMRMIGGSLTSLQLRLRDNVASVGEGGGLLAIDASGLIDRGDFWFNECAFGASGGGALIEGGSWTLEETEFFGNIGGDGAGLALRPSEDGLTLAMSESNLELNDAFADGSNEGRGGGLWVDDTGAGPVDVELFRCLFKENRAFSTSAVPVGVAHHGPAELVNCSVFFNTLVGTGPGAAIFGATLENGIVWDNTGPSLLDASATWSDIQGGAAGLGNLDVEPDVWEFDDQPQFGAPVIDAGNPAHTDPDGTRIDMGWRFYYGNPAGFPTCTAVENSTGIPAWLMNWATFDLVNNDLKMEGRYMPPGEAVYPIISLSSSWTPGVVSPPMTDPAGLCLTGSIGRLNHLVRQVDEDGEVWFDLDLTAFPVSAGGPVQVGQEWFFQLWYRDPTFANPSGFTNTVRTSFF